MRFISCALLTLFATVAAGQPATGSLSCYPNDSVPEGGGEITIGTNNFYRFKAPQVFFGGVASPRVTVVNPDTVKAEASVFTSPSICSSPRSCHGGSQMSLQYPEACGVIGWAFCAMQIAGFALSCVYFAPITAAFSGIVAICLGLAAWLT